MDAGMTRKQTTAVALAIALQFLAAFPAGAESGAWSPWRFVSRLFEAPSWKEAVAAVDSPRKAAKLVRLYVRFTEEEGDEWADGKTTWDRGYGDCEDLAAAVVRLCADAGLDAGAKINVFSDSIRGNHAVAVGKWRGRMWIASNGWFEYVDSMADAVLRVSAEMRWNAAAVKVTPLDQFTKVPGAAAASRVAGHGI